MGLNLHLDGSNLIIDKLQYKLYVELETNEEIFLDQKLEAQ